jgi:hypothetical protein
MFVFLISFAIGLTVHLQGTIEDLKLVVTNSRGEVVEQVFAPTPGDYAFEDLPDGTYTVRALVRETVIASIFDVVVPLMESIVINVSPESVESSEQESEGARRNQNIQINLVDTQALMESLDRQGAQVIPVTEFSATRQNYAAEFGGVGQSSDRRQCPWDLLPPGALRNPQQQQVQCPHVLSSWRSVAVATQSVWIPFRWAHGLGQALVPGDRRGDTGIRVRERQRARPAAERTGFDGDRSRGPGSGPGVAGRFSRGTSQSAGN